MEMSRRTNWLKLHLQLERVSVGMCICIQCIDDYSGTLSEMHVYSLNIRINIERRPPTIQYIDFMRYYTVTITLAFLYHPNIAFSPLRICVSST